MKVDFETIIRLTGLFVTGLILMLSVPPCRVLYCRKKGKTFELFIRRK
jgi:hypothetical protein